MKKFEEASISNSSLHNVFSKSLDDLKTLSMPLNELEKKLPKVDEGY